VEFIMTSLDPALRAEILGQILAALGGAFPGQMLEVLIARREGGT
jgi:hypothetical protein